MTADFANSSIWQRVLDSHGLLFWIQPKLTGQLSFLTAALGIRSLFYAQALDF